jgi:hypothetical protein
VSEPSELASADSGVDRRRYRRTRANVYCRPAGEDFFAARFDVVDISFGGLRIHGEDEPVVRSRMRLDVFLIGAPPATCTAEVVWARRLPAGSPAPFEAGLRFCELSAVALTGLLPLLRADVESASLDAPRSEPRPTHLSGPPVAPPEEEPVSAVRPSTPPARDPSPRIASRVSACRVPIVLANTETLAAAGLNSQAGFIVSLLDGVTTVEELLDISPMPADTTLAILAALCDLGLVELR